MQYAARTVKSRDPLGLVKKGRTERAYRQRRSIVRSRVFGEAPAAVSREKGRLAGISLLGCTSLLFIAVRNLGEKKKYLFFIRIFFLILSLIITHVHVCVCSISDSYTTPRSGPAPG